MIVALVPLLMLASAQPAPVGGQTRCTGTHYRQAVSGWRDGEAAFRAGRWAQADRFYAQGLARLGNRYSRGPASPGPAGLIDDTGQHLSLAYELGLKGQFRDAARERGSMLDSRLQLYRQGWNCK